MIITRSDWNLLILGPQLHALPLQSIAPQDFTRQEGRGTCLYYFTQACFGAQVVPVHQTRAGYSHSWGGHYEQQARSFLLLLLLLLLMMMSSLLSLLFFFCLFYVFFSFSFPSLFLFLQLIVMPALMFCLLLEVCYSFQNSNSSGWASALPPWRFRAHLKNPWAESQGINRIAAFNPCHSIPKNFRNSKCGRLSLGIL